MSLATPTTSQLSTTLVSQIEASLSQTVPLLPKAALRVLAKALAGVVVILYKYAGFIFLQLFVQAASFAETTVNGRVLRPLVEWGRLIGAGDPGPGERAQLVLSVPVLVQSGSLEAGRLYTGPNGVTYRVTANVPLNASSVSVTVEALSDPNGNEGYGSIGNLANGSKLSLAVPLANVSREGTVTSTAVQGSEPELEEDYRDRVIARFQRRPQGGSYADYSLWGLDAAGIVAVYPYKAALPGQIDLYVESTTAPDGLASPTQLAAVITASNFDEEGRATRRPVNDALNAYSITRTAFDLEIQNLQAPNVTDTQAAISSGVDQWLRDREPYIEGLSVLPRKDRITQPELAGIISGIVAANGGSFSGLVVRRASVIVTSYTLTAGELAKRGTVTYP